MIKFASYNIHKAVGTDRRRDPERIIAVLREIDADVIALQEADLRLGDRASVLPRAALDDTKWRAASVARRHRSIGWHGNALLVRRDFELGAARALELPTLEPRGAICCDITVGGSSLRVVGTHLDLSGLRRRDQVRSIMDQLIGCEGDLPAVIMGDFNQWGTRRGAMKEFGDDWHAVDCGRSFPSRQPIATLDRIVASAGWHCRDKGVHHSALAAVASDHLPVWAHLEMPKN
ncbi:endonuclease/exonuclease/phosphatase family protein [Pseudopontixanthobacter vadosimaris]|uniref:endonuclease/exonuclease/phosphatase family protein n=1 Tax=Pseudopontixanthobacter vadosimaris TaxID=2726450 RepID=UPI001475C25D|nr:endonuclease/exonuclease/phosphatase family protein [Pseudopontixanthobacter vadosimaris]